MKIAMIGSGAAGSVFAGYLRRGGADLTLVDPYKEHMDKIAKDGLTFVIYPDNEYQLTGFKTAYNADNIGVMDIVIFMTKATQLENAIETAKPCIGENTVLVSLINGLGNEDKLAAAVGPGRVIYGSGVLGTALDGPGKCISSPGADKIQMNFGPMEMNELTEKAGKHLEECFINGGCPAKFWDDVRPAMWTKVVVNSVFNPLSERPCHGNTGSRRVLRRCNRERLPDGPEDVHGGRESSRRHRNTGLLPQHGIGYAHVQAPDRDNDPQRCSCRIRQAVRHTHAGL